MSVRQKFTIADVQQKKLLELGLDIKDAFILSYLKDVNPLKKMIRKKIDGRTFIWIDYEKLMNYLPALKIKSLDAIYRRFKKYQESNLLDKHIHKTMNGSYSFFYLKEEFFNLFEITQDLTTDKELEEQLKKMGLPLQSDEKSVGSGQKVGYTSDEKSAINTPINNTPTKDSSSRKEDTTASDDDFTKDLKDLLSKSSVNNINSNTLKNICKFSSGDIREVERAIDFMKLKNKSITPGILVAILRDGDFKDKNSIAPTEIKRNDKIEFMAVRIGELEVRRLRDELLREIGFECNAIDDQLGNILCRKFNIFLSEGGIYVR